MTSLLRALALFTIAPVPGRSELLATKDIRWQRGFCLCKLPFRFCSRRLRYFLPSARESFSAWTPVFGLRV